MYILIQITFSKALIKLIRLDSNINDILQYFIHSLYSSVLFAGHHLNAFLGGKHKNASF